MSNNVQWKVTALEAVKVLDRFDFNFVTESVFFVNGRSDIEAIDKVYQHQGVTEILDVEECDNAEQPY